MPSPISKSSIPLSYLDTDTALTADSDVKVATQKATKAYVQSVASPPTVATGAEVDTGTDNTKMVTPKAIADSNVAFTSDIPTVPVKATGAELVTGTDDAKFATAKALVDAYFSRFSTPTALSDGATIDIDHTLNTMYWVVLGGNRIFTLSNVIAGKPIILDIGQDGTGSRTVTWFATKAVTATLTIASPCVVTSNLDIPTATPIILTTTGALPTGLTASTRYYWIRQSTTTGNLATTIANAQAGTAINTSGSQSGTHTFSVQIRWGYYDTIPTLTTGKHRFDTVVIIPRDTTNGIYTGFMANMDF